MAETEYTNGMLHDSKLNVSVDFLNINIRIKLYDLKSRVLTWIPNKDYIFSPKKNPIYIPLLFL